jgi:hypothetical protein
MAVFAVTHHQRLDDYAVVQTLEDTDIGIGQSILLAGLGHGSERYSHRLCNQPLLF